MTDAKKTCQKKTVLLESKVVIEPGNSVLYSWMTEKQRNDELQRWAREVFEFLHDHRSMDVNGVRVDHEFEEQCSVCGRKWEEVEYEAEGDEPAFIGCGWCATPVEEKPKCASS